MGKRAARDLSATESFDPWAHDAYLRHLLGATPGLGLRGLQAIVLEDHHAEVGRPMRRWLQEAQSTALSREQLASE